MRSIHSRSSASSSLCQRLLTINCALTLTALLLLSPATRAQVVNGTYNVTESWTVTLEYNNFAGRYTGTKNFSGQETGKLVINNGNYTLINKTGLQVSSLDPSLLSRSIDSYGGGVSISGDYAFAPAYGAKAYGLVFLGCFAVKVSLVDGEVPAFYNYDLYSAYGSSLGSLSGGGDMIGDSLRATVSSTIWLTKVVGPPRILTQPQGQTVYAGQDATFSVIPGGDPPFSYSWRKGNTVLTGQTASSLIVTNVQSSDAGSYSVVVSNPGGTVTSSTAKLIVNAPPPAWIETWDSASPGSYPPATNGDTFISADAGAWHIGDTVANFPDCWPEQNHADILTDGGRKLLKLVSVPNAGSCAENIWAATDANLSQGLPIPLLRSTEISFFEQGSMTNPEWNGLFSCITPPCGDVVSLRITDDHANQVVYILQRAPNYVEHAITNHQTGAYLEVFLDTAGGTFSRNLFDDLTRVAGQSVGTAVVGVEFSLGAEGWATLDDLQIGSTTPPVVDNTAPTVKVSTPANNAQLKDAAVTMTGTAKDNNTVGRVEFSLNGSDFQPASGTTSWMARLDLSPGQNEVRVRAVDTSGNVSPEVTREFNYVLSAPLAVGISGNGSVKPNYDGQWLEVGKSYSITAKPDRNNAFAGWSGSVVSSDPKLAFVMDSNLVLQANFLLNPFLPVAGNYQGLFYDTNGVAYESAGFITAKVTQKGTFSARLLLAGGRYSFAGQFSGSGVCSNTIARQGLASLTVQLQLDLTGDTLTGELSDGTWNAQLIADRATFNARSNPAPQAGKYTLVVPGGNSPSQPGGDSFGSVSVDGSGNVKFKGVLSDGSKITQKAALSKRGEWPFYASVSGNGLIIGWLNFTNPPDDGIGGWVSWIRQPQPGATYYPSGFSVQSEAVGSKYAFAKGQPLLNFSTGQLRLAGGNLLQNLTNGMTVGSNNKVSGPNNLKLLIAPATGLFKGNLTEPTTGRKLRLSGAVLQSQGVGRGFFLGTDQAGGVWFGPP